MTSSRIQTNGGNLYATALEHVSKVHHVFHWQLQVIMISILNEFLDFFFLLFSFRGRRGGKKEKKREEKKGKNIVNLYAKIALSAELIQIFLPPAELPAGARGVSRK